MCSTSLYVRNYPGMCSDLIEFFILLQTCCHYPYFRFLKNTGIELSFFTIRCSTTVLNRPLQKWGIWRPRFLQMWFTVGTFVSLALLPVSIVVLLRSFVLEIRQRATAEPANAAALELVVRITSHALQ